MIIDVKKEGGFGKLLYLCTVKAAIERAKSRMLFELFRAEAGSNDVQFKTTKKIMATLILQIPDESLVSKVKQACKMIVGVASIQVQRPAKKKVYDITKTAGYREAMDDVKHGRVHHADSVDDMFKDILGEDIFNEIRRSHV